MKSGIYLFFIIIIYLFFVIIIYLFFYLLLIFLLFLSFSNVSKIDTLENDN
jgi:hypothetical protein